MEIERKYLIDLNKIDLNQCKEKISIKQGYLLKEISKTIRIRITNNASFMTIKGETKGISREEIEFIIPLEDAEKLLLFCGNDILEKTRYVFVINDKKWEIDFFHGNLEGLILAEIELKNEEEQIDLPDFILKEVSYDNRYYNSNLIERKFPF